MGHPLPSGSLKTYFVVYFKNTWYSIFSGSLKKNCAVYFDDPEVDDPQALRQAIPKGHRGVPTDKATESRPDPAIFFFVY